MTEHTFYIFLIVMAVIALLIFTALLRDTDFVNKLHSCVENLPEKLRREVDESEKRWKATS